MRSMSSRGWRMVAGVFVAAVVVYWVVVWVLTACGVAGGPARWVAWAVVGLMAIVSVARGLGSPVDRDSVTNADLYGRRDWRNDPLSPWRH